MGETAYTWDQVSVATGFSMKDISPLLSDLRGLYNVDGVTVDGYWALLRQFPVCLSLIVSVRNRDGVWEVTERCIDVVADDFLLAVTVAGSIGGDPGQEVLLRLVRDDGIELARREVVIRDGG